MASLTVDAMRKWGINFSTSDKLKYTFLMTKHEEVNDHIVIFVLHMSAVLTSFPFPVVFKFCVVFFFFK